jgi:hypothetical protein
VADEATVVGTGRAYWAAAFSRCDWIYPGKSREVDMAARGHCRVCGGDVVAMTTPGKEVVLRLERDVLGRVIVGSPTTELNAEPELIDTDQAMREYGERIQRPEYWKLENTRNRSGLED